MWKTKTNERGIKWAKNQDQGRYRGHIQNLIRRADDLLKTTRDYYTRELFFYDFFLFKR